MHTHTHCAVCAFYYFNCKIKINLLQLMHFTILLFNKLSRRNWNLLYVICQFNCAITFITAAHTYLWLRRYVIYMSFNVSCYMHFNSFFWYLLDILNGLCKLCTQFILRLYFCYVSTVQRGVGMLSGVSKCKLQAKQTWLIWLEYSEKCFCACTVLRYVRSYKSISLGEGGCCLFVSKLITILWSR